MLPAVVQDGNLRSSGCALTTVEGAVAESRGDRDTTLRLHDVWSPNKPDYDRLRRIHDSMLLGCLGWRKRKRDDHTLSYAYALAKTSSESIDRGDSAQTEDIVCGIRSTYGGKRLPQRVMFGELVGGKGYSGGQGKDRLVHLKEDMSLSVWNEV